MNGLLFWPIYLAPSLIAWYRMRQGKPVIGTIGGLFFFNMLLGWTGFMWLLCLANAFGKNPVAWVVWHLVGGGGASGPAGNTSPGAPSSESSRLVPCTQCQGSGTLACSSCGGRGSWYEGPQGESGTAQLRTCPACTSSGRLRCSYCGGSGRVAGY